jgi:hypothetical protein
MVLVDVGLEGIKYNPQTGEAFTQQGQMITNPALMQNVQAHYNEMINPPPPQAYNIQPEQIAEYNGITYAKVGGQVYNLGSSGNMVQDGMVLNRISQKDVVDLNAGQNAIKYAAIFAGKDPYAAIEQNQNERLAALTPGQIMASRAYKYLENRVGAAKAYAIQAGIYKPQPYKPTAEEKSYENLSSSVGGRQASLVLAGKYYGDKPTSSIVSSEGEAKQADMLALKSFENEQIPSSIIAKLGTPSGRAELGLGKQAPGYSDGYEQNFISAGTPQSQVDTGHGISYIISNPPSISTTSISTTPAKPIISSEPETGRTVVKYTSDPSTWLYLPKGASVSEMKLQKNPQTNELDWIFSYSLNPSALQITKGTKEEAMATVELAVLLTEQYRKTDTSKIPKITANQIISPDVGLYPKDLISIAASAAGAVQRTTASNPIMITTPSDFEKITYQAKQIGIPRAGGSNIISNLPVGTGARSFTSAVFNDLDTAYQGYQNNLEAIINTKTQKGVGNYLAPIVSSPVGQGVQITKLGMGLTSSIIYGGEAINLEIAKYEQGGHLTNEQLRIQNALKREAAVSLGEVGKQTAEFYVISKIFPSGEVVGKGAGVIVSKVAQPSTSKVEQFTTQYLFSETGRKVALGAYVASGFWEGIRQDASGNAYYDIYYGAGAATRNALFVVAGEQIPKAAGKALNVITHERYNPFVKEKIVSIEEAEGMKRAGVISQAEQQRGLALSRSITEGAVKEYKDVYQQMLYAQQEKTEAQTELENIAYRKSEIAAYKPKTQLGKSYFEILISEQAKSVRQNAEAAYGGIVKSAAKREKALQNQLDYLSGRIETYSKASEATSGITLTGFTPEGLEETTIIKIVQKPKIEGGYSETKTIQSIVEKPQKEKYGFVEWLFDNEKHAPEKNSVFEKGEARPLGGKRYNPSDVISGKGGTAQTGFTPSRQPVFTPINFPFFGPPTKPSSKQPTNQPSNIIFKQPAKSPAKQPSKQPTQNSISQPSRQPTQNPINIPQREPTRQPTRQPNRQPSRQPTRQPTRQPVRQPILSPIRSPIREPVRQPVRQPINQPVVVPGRQITSLKLGFLITEPPRGEERKPKQSKRSYQYTSSLIAVSENIRATKANPWDVIGGFGIRPMVSGKTNPYGQPLDNIISRRGKRK